MEIIAYGVPCPQGSKSLGVNRRTGKAVMHEANKGTKPWRNIVWHETRESGYIVEGPVRITLVFTMPKPASSPKRKKTLPATKPDIDKLCRAVLDAMKQAGAFEDDSRVVDLRAIKVFPSEHLHALDRPGVRIIFSKAV